MPVAPQPTNPLESQLAALGEIDFNFHVKPILSQNCYLCHGPDPSSREAELRLDLAEEAEDLLGAAPEALEDLPLEADQAIQRLEAADADWSFEFPVEQHPEKVKSMTFDKLAKVEGILQGIKGQYLVFDTGVINLRRFTSYEIEVTVSEATVSGDAEVQLSLL